MVDSFKNATQPQTQMHIMFFFLVMIKMHTQLSFFMHTVLTKDSDGPSYGCNAYRCGSDVPLVVGTFHTVYIQSNPPAADIQKNLHKQISNKKQHNKLTLSYN